MQDPERQPANIDEKNPERTGENMGGREPLEPSRNADADEREPLPEGESYERSRDKNPLDEERLRFDRRS